MMIRREIRKEYFNVRNISSANKQLSILVAEGDESSSSGKRGNYSCLRLSQ